MKTLFIVLLLSGVPAQAKEFHLVYRFAEHKLEYVINAKDVAAALDQGADACFDVFSQRMPISIDQKYDLIDTCTNPQVKP